MIQGYSPRTGQPVGPLVPETTDAGVDAVVSAAAAAFPAWDSFRPARRADVLDAVADALDARVSELVPLADAETALGEVRLTGEVARTTGQLRHLASALRDGGYLDITVSPAGAGAPELRRVSRPLGPVAVFAASNFPFAFSVAGGDTASALAAGCPVIVKAHEAHPGTSALTAQIVAAALAQAGAPDGVFSIVHGIAAGVRLLNHPAIKAAGFTGSARGGFALAAICAARPVPIPFFGELGSVNPVVVLPGAAAAQGGEIATGYAGSLTLGVGQFCTNPGLLFVPDDPALRTAIAAAVTESTGGPMLAARIHDAYVAGVAELAKHPAVQPLATGKPGGGPWAGTPQVFATTLKEFADGLPELAEEHFGPAGLVITYPSLDDLLAVLTGLHGNLAGTVHVDTTSSDDVAAAGRVVAVLERIVGRIAVNGWPTGVAVVAAQQHGGPWPATTAPAYTSVGSAAILRWLTPVAYQNFPSGLLPDAARS